MSTDPRLHELRERALDRAARAGERANKPNAEDVFICRWREWLASVRHDDKRAADFARYFFSLSNKLEVTLRWQEPQRSARR